ncbi:motility protein A [Halodesulfovibrio aestuarii]|uniref:Chemotaxis protein MotA n=1 Tax=Halodesulfovibrio aestuarii TaxID=126333 RepID=A0A8G2F6F2_9BACT|nr:motility protein A [Halodesulfovibrio aestuarii]SHI48204.1 chemotaxis protein MotA [Halodesulfovibrio aestuarii]
MDIATLLGVIVGFALVTGAIFMGGSVGDFINVPGAMIVFGGSGAAIFVSFPLEEVAFAVASVVKVFASRRTKVPEVVNTMVRIAEISRREGLVALENIKTESPLLKKACQLISDNADPDIIHDTLKIEILSMKRRQNIAIAVFNRLGAVAPAFGMIGTLIGLVQMLAHLDDPSSIGPAMAVALLTTFYGALLANLLFLPMAGKLKARTLQEEVQLNIIFEGAKCILENNNPRLVYEKLSSFISPEDRKNVRR